MPRREDAKRVSMHPDNAAVPFSDYAAGGWAMETECYACKRAVYTPGAELVRLFGAQASTGSIYRRMRCSACGAGFPAVRAVILPD